MQKLFFYFIIAPIIICWGIFTGKYWPRVKHFLMYKRDIRGLEMIAREIRRVTPK